ncbi:unnamed protein product [Cuscuta epithymum]|uniref:AAA+ ATPase domain-containing protein n=1 Tax=Cuscuta epithymum TaxID=186058 RepID=A0AAV0D3X1_9ASTE|nr:unnamed protein product [Cuscuta epithymum]
MIVERWRNAGAAIASFLFVWKIVRKYLPPGLLNIVKRWTRKWSVLFNPYVQISIDEYIKKNMGPHAAYAAVEAYLSSIKSVKEVNRLKAQMVGGGENQQLLTLSIDADERVDDEFRGASVEWVSASRKPPPQLKESPWQPSEKRCYNLIFHKKYRDLITDSYLDHVIRTGEEWQARCRKQMLFTNGGSGKAPWKHVPFDHPASFENLAMDTKKKMELVEDLVAFKEGKDFYRRIGRAWKRGYLLHGPPGTGKSTLIAAMANLLHYDIYDLELTSVSDNTHLKQLLAETTGKSILVIEDIDCSLDLTGNRMMQHKASTEDASVARNKSNNSGSKVTLSGLLNFIDGLWSSCSEERIIVFTTNHVEKLDPALTRRGRMDKHIELSYCTFEGFKVLARNYLQLEDHPMFESIKELLMKETNKITPADVAENLMLMTSSSCLHHDAANRCLQNLAQALQQANPNERIHQLMD